MEELWSSQVLFYSLSEHYTNFVQLKVTLDSPIDRAALQRALDTTILRFPYFKVRLVRSGNKYVLEDNDGPLRVYDDAKSPTLLSKENNEYLIRVCAEDSLLNICFCHALTDGRGIMPFLKTLLHYYWLYATGIMSGAPDVRLAGDTIPEKEFRDPMLDFKPDLSSAGGQSASSADPKIPFELPVTGAPEGTKYFYSFSLDSNVFMNYSHEVDGSPNALIALFMSKAIRKLHPHADNIMAGVAIDLRHACGGDECLNIYELFGGDESHQCCVGLLLLPYRPSMDRMDIRTCATCFRGCMILQSDDEMRRASLAASQQFYQYLSSMDSFEEKCRISSGAVIRGSSAATFSVSYVGKQDYGSINSHIRFIGAIVDTLVMHLAIEIMCVDERFFITVTQDFNDDRYVREMINLMEAEGIRSENYCMGSTPYVHMSVQDHMV
jgi:hypothetical protein